MLPFAVIVVAFLGVPLYYVIHGAFSTNTGGFTLANFSAVFSHAQYLRALRNDAVLALWTSIGPAILGLWFAAAIVAGNPDGLLRRIVASASGVLAYFAGAPLAFAVIASYGTLGTVTVLINSLFHVNLTNTFSTASILGVGLTYFYFQIPLMVIFVTPALEGLRPEWEEAARNLGATRAQYLRRVAAPVLAPSVIAATLLLFGSAFSAYATALALDGGTIDIVPTQINLALSNNVIVGQTNVGEALGAEMILIVAVVMVLYWFVQRRAGRWLR
ncbi:ABC transporter permease subunit [Conexibacter sp. DBS9H8]|uniref:ABC transporter permease n=1 Tax=Conexibacter sp. DBS9H8 TaxID=2937801 RepID=UPI0020108230|nr:ABC transporter permease subunit [Conexibacter sp. DBS9H8]